MIEKSTRKHLQREIKLLIKDKQKAFDFLKSGLGKQTFSEVIIFKFWMKIIYHLKFIQIINQV